MPGLLVSSIAFSVAALLAPAVLAAELAGDDPKDLYFGEALYYAQQEEYFEALERLDAEIAQHYAVDEPQLDSLHPQIGHAEFCIGDFELSYRMHHRAGRAIQRVLQGNVPEPVRNEGAFRLARIHFQKGHPEEALQALDAIHGEIPVAIQDDIEFLRANVYLALDRPSDAVPVLKKIQGSQPLKGFAAYNLGIALLQEGKQREALEQLDRAGRVDSDDASTLAIRDKSNLVLGSLLFEASEFGPAQGTLDRVRLEGPFSNQALLRAGWADASAENFQRAVVPWAILAEREPTDAAVQEALLALPYSYSRLSVHGRAALLYERAAEVFGGELTKLDSSLKSVTAGAFLKALVREEIRQDKDWVIRLRSLPDAPETFYLTSLMASHDFQTALQNYLDLEDLRKKLVSWQASLDAFSDLIRQRRKYYEPRLPGIDRDFRKLDAHMRLRLEQREHLDKRIQQLLIAPRPELLATGVEQRAKARLEQLEVLATADEQRTKARLEQLEAGLRDANGPEATALLIRIDRLKGVLHWVLETQYHARLTETYQHLRDLDGDVAALKSQYDAFVRTRQQATHGYAHYDERIKGLRARVKKAQKALGPLMASQGHVLELVAARELKLRRERLVAYQDQARFAFADSYDRAVKAQAH
jgi:predicted negative regulator of RcsB-dependent stress response